MSIPNQTSTIQDNSYSSFINKYEVNGFQIPQLHRNIIMYSAGIHEESHVLDTHQMAIVKDCIDKYVALKERTGNDLHLEGIFDDFANEQETEENNANRLKKVYYAFIGMALSCVGLGIGSGFNPTAFLFEASSLLGPIIFGFSFTALIFGGYVARKLARNLEKNSQVSVLDKAYDYFKSEQLSRESTVTRDGVELTEATPNITSVSIEGSGGDVPRYSTSVADSEIPHYGIGLTPASVDGSAYPGPRLLVPDYKEGSGGDVPHYSTSVADSGIPHYGIVLTPPGVARPAYSGPGPADPYSTAGSGRNTGAPDITGSFGGSYPSDASPSYGPEISAGGQAEFASGYERRNLAAIYYSPPSFGGVIPPGQGYTLDEVPGEYESGGAILPPPPLPVWSTSSQPGDSRRYGQPESLGDGTRDDAGGYSPPKWRSSERSEEDRATVGGYSRKAESYTSLPHSLSDYRPALRNPRLVHFDESASLTRGGGYASSGLQTRGGGDDRSKSRMTITGPSLRSNLLRRGAESSRKESGEGDHRPPR